RVWPSDAGAPLAPGLEPVRAMEVGFSVPGSAARQRNRRSNRAALAAGIHSAEKNSVKAVRFIIATVVCSAVFSAAGHAQLAKPKATITAFAEREEAAAGSPVRLALRVSLPDGLHTQSNRPRDPNLIPTVLTVDAPAGVTLDEIVFPPSTDL